MKAAKHHQSAEQRRRVAEARERAPAPWARYHPAALPSSKSHRGPGCSGQTDAQATRQAWREPLQSPCHAGSGHQRLLVSGRARPRVSAHRHRCVCTPGACATGLARTRPSSASGVLLRGRKMRFASRSLPSCQPCDRLSPPVLPLSAPRRAPRG